MTLYCGNIRPQCRCVCAVGPNVCRPGLGRDQRPAKRLPMIRAVVGVLAHEARKALRMHSCKRIRLIKWSTLFKWTRAPAVSNLGLEIYGFESHRPANFHRSSSGLRDIPRPCSSVCLYNIEWWLIGALPPSHKRASFGVVGPSFLSPLPIDNAMKRLFSKKPKKSSEPSKQRISSGITGITAGLLGFRAEHTGPGGEYNLVRIWR
jgi:hypothetical protein